MSIFARVLDLLPKPRPQTERKYDVCEDCRQWFYLTPIEVSAYLIKSIPFPKKCRSCLAEERRQSEQLIANL